MLNATANAELERTQNPAETQVYRVARPAPPHEIPALAARLLGHLDGQRSLSEACALAQIPVAKADAIVRKLTSLGIVSAARRPKRTLTSLPGSAAFSAEEEAFFASEVAPIDECDEPFESLGEKMSLAVSELILRLKGSPAF